MYSKALAPSAMSSKFILEEMDERIITYPSVKAKMDLSAS